jgi:hypothetical protein
LSARHVSIQFWPLRLAHLDLRHERLQQVDVAMLAAAGDLGVVNRGAHLGEGVVELGVRRQVGEAVNPDLVAEREVADHVLVEARHRVAVDHDLGDRSVRKHVQPQLARMADHLRLPGRERSFVLVRHVVGRLEHRARLKQLDVALEPGRGAVRGADVAGGVARRGLDLALRL